MAKEIFFFQWYNPKSICTSGAELPDHQRDLSLPGCRSISIVSMVCVGGRDEQPWAEQEAVMQN